MVTTRIEDDHLIVRIPLKREAYPSTTGRSMIIASTDGPANTEGELDGLPIGLRLTAWIPRWTSKEKSDE